MTAVETARSLCPCGSGSTFDDCCGRFIRGEALPATAEALMRSRYTAFATGAGEYLAATHHPAYRSAEDAAAIRSAAEETEWLKLDILKSLSNAKEAEVVFKAYSRTAEGIAIHFEQSRFIKEEDRWFYTDGMAQAAEVSRNESCPCGSGKKYKRCCGA